VIAQYDIHIYMYPFDSDLHLVALSPEPQHQQSNTTVTISIQHHPQQAAKNTCPLWLRRDPAKPPATRGDDHTNPIPSRHSGGGITLHSEPHQRQYLTSKGTRTTGSPTLSTVRMWTRHTNMRRYEHIVWCPMN